jgi:GTP-binding protein
VYEGLKRREVKEAALGDIVAITGLDAVNIGDTIADTEHPEALPAIKVDEPTLSMIFSVNPALRGARGQVCNQPPPARTAVQGSRDQR